MMVDVLFLQRHLVWLERCDDLAGRSIGRTFSNDDLTLGIE
jgi:hypothetical protein